MYTAIVRSMIRKNVELLNAGNYGPTLAMFADDATLAFPGDNSWARQFAEPARGREQSPTHRGRTEIEAFLRRYADAGVQMTIEDILINGGPWKARVAVRAQVWIPKIDGTDLYANRVVLMVRSAWGKVRDQEDYVDTQRSAALDEALAVGLERW